jgi:hypothetical protein
MEKSFKSFDDSFINVEKVSRARTKMSIDGKVSLMFVWAKVLPFKSSAKDIKVAEAHPVLLNQLI